MQTSSDVAPHSNPNDHPNNIPNPNTEATISSPCHYHHHHHHHHPTTTEEEKSPLPFSQQDAPLDMVSSLPFSFRGSPSSGDEDSQGKAMLERGGGGAHAPPPPPSPSKLEVARSVSTPKRSATPDALSSPQQQPQQTATEDEDDRDVRDKKRQRRLLQNRQSAALSRQRKKEYLSGLESRNETLEADNKVLKQTLYVNDNRIRELENRLAFFVKQNEDLKNLLRTSDKADEMNRLLAQAYLSLALQTTGISLFSGINFHQNSTLSSNIHAQPTVAMRTEEVVPHHHNHSPATKPEPASESQSLSEKKNCFSTQAPEGLSRNT